MKNAELVISQTVNFALWTLPPNKSRTKVPPLSPASKEYIIASYDKDVRTSFIMFQEYYHWHGAIYSIPFQKENHQDMFPQTSHHKFLWSSLSAASMANHFSLKPIHPLLFSTTIHYIPLQETITPYPEHLLLNIRSLRPLSFQPPLTLARSRQMQHGGVQQVLLYRVFYIH